ncbi:MAG: hypothetical protein KGJ37_03010, partial [Verrucomicrobiota bacterium]|nr:hypothetical protein [Verrucomicrobiota bacterium]
LQHTLARRLPGMTLGPLWPSLIKVLAGTLVMGAAVWAGWHLVGGMAAEIHLFRFKVRVADLAAVLGLIPLGVAIYGAALWLLKIEGRDELKVVLRKLRGAGSPPPPPIAL